MFYEKKLGSLIFWTLLTKNCPFLVNFDKPLFLVKLLKVYYQSGPEFNLALIFAQLLPKLVTNFIKNKSLSKFFKNEQFSVSKVQKMTEPKIFFIKHKILRIYDFHNTISISGLFDVFEWVPDGPEPHGDQDGFGAQQEGPTVKFLIPGGLF